MLNTPQGMMYGMRGALSDGNAYRNRGGEQFATGYASGNPRMPIFNTPNFSQQRAMAKPMPTGPGGHGGGVMPNFQGAPPISQLLGQQQMPQPVSGGQMPVVGSMPVDQQIPRPYIPRFAMQMRGRNGYGQ